MENRFVILFIFLSVPHPLKYFIVFSSMQTIVKNIFVYFQCVLPDSAGVWASNGQPTAVP